MQDPREKNPDLKRKGYEAEIKNIDPKEHSVTAYVSTITKDSYDEVVIPRFDFERFRKNPVVPWGHIYSLPPVGKGLWVKADDRGLIGKTRFAVKTPVGLDIWNLYAEGFLNAFSIGYDVGKKIHSDDAAWAELLERYAFDETAVEVHDENMLWEWSAVTLPANEDAVVQAMKEGLVKSEDLEVYVDRFFRKKIDCSYDQKGERLAALLNRLIDAMVDDDNTRSEIIAEMARAAGISPDTVAGILRGEINCPPLNRLRGFAGVLNTSLSRLRSAAESDGCEYGETNAENADLSRLLDEIHKINEKLDKVVTHNEKVNLYQEALKIEQELKNNRPVPAAKQEPEIVVDFEAALRRLPAIVDGAIRNLTGKMDG